VRTLWNEKHTAAFRALRDLVSQHGVRVIPDYNRPFYLRSDASVTGWAVLLLQADATTGILRLVACHCGRFTEAAQTQKVNHREAFAVVMGVRSLGDLMDCIKVTLQADHNNILYWYNSKDPVMRRWWFEFARTNPPIQHIPGESNVVADGLSRSPTPSITPSRPVAGPNFETTLMAPITTLVPSARETRAAARAAPRLTPAPTGPPPATPTLCSTAPALCT
jgi:hypothetical protein